VDWVASFRMAEWPRVPVTVRGALSLGFRLDDATKLGGECPREIRPPS
jgi:hypothetical protein